MFCFIFQTFNEEKVHPHYGGHHQVPSSDHEDYYDDEDELIDLNFKEDMISQPYLSLGLTPVSQLSPDPLMSSSTGTSELGFFPSMLPPISPISSMMNGTTNTGGLPQVDDDMSDSHPPLDSLIMPDGLVSYNLAPIDPHKVKNKAKADQQRSDGVKLETVMEHSSLEADDLSSSFSGFSSRLVDPKASTTLNTSTMSTSEDELIFPSADGQSPLTTRKKPTSDLGGFDTDFDMFPSAFNNTTTSISLSKLHQPTTTGNGHMGPPSNTGNSRSSSNLLDNFMDFDSVNPNEQAKQRRIHAREKAIAEQKALLLEKERKEKLERARLNQERQEKIAQDYATFTSNTNQRSKPRGTVLQQIGMFEAAAEINDEKKSQEKRSQELTSPTRSPRYGISGLVSPHRSYSGRPRKPSNDSLDPKPVEDQVTIL